MNNYLPIDGRPDSRAAIYIKKDSAPDVLFNVACERQYAAKGLLLAIGNCEIVEGEAKGISDIARAIAILVGDAEALYEAAFQARKGK